MPIIKKKTFIAEDLRSIQSLDNKEDIDELVDGEGGFISGDRNVTSNSEIETGPVQKPFNSDSDYEKGVSTTTDKAARYRQDIPWFASMSGAGARRVQEGKSKTIVTKKSMEETIEDLVMRRKRDGEVMDKNYNSKVVKIVDLITDTELTEEQLEEVKQALAGKKAGTNKTI